MNYSMQKWLRYGYAVMLHGLFFRWDIAVIFYWDILVTETFPSFVSQLY